MKHSLKLSVAILATCFSAMTLAADDVHSLRGADVSAADASTQQYRDFTGKRPGTQSPIARFYSTQPPVIPHAVENFDEINLEENQCLDCHDASNYKKKNSPKVSDTHFLDREGKKTPEATAARYNCVQCHVPQTDAPPLVENTFKGDLSTKGKAAAKTKKN